MNQSLANHLALKSSSTCFRYFQPDAATNAATRTANGPAPAKSSLGNPNKAVKHPPKRKKNLVSEIYLNHNIFKSTDTKP